MSPKQKPLSCVLKIVNPLKKAKKISAQKKSRPTATCDKAGTPLVCFWISGNLFAFDQNCLHRGKLEIYLAVCYGSVANIPLSLCL